MPGSILSVDNSFPKFSGRESTEEKISTILNYLYQLREQLRWTLGNLDAENFNSTGLKEIGETFSKPIYGRIEDVEGNVSELSLTAGTLTARISSAEGDISTLSLTASGLSTRMTNAEGNISTLSLTASGLSTRMTNAEGNISTLSLTASGLSTRMTNAEGNITTLALTVNGLTLTAASGESFSLVSLKAGEITLSSAVIAFTGVVTFSSLSGYGTSVINGANIMTSTITADKIGANDAYASIKFSSPINCINGGIIFDDFASINRYPGTDSLEISTMGAVFVYAPSGLYVNGTKIAT